MGKRTQYRMGKLFVKNNQDIVHVVHSDLGFHFETKVKVKPHKKTVSHSDDRRMYREKKVFRVSSI